MKWHLLVFLLLLVYGGQAQLEDCTRCANEKVYNAGSVTIDSVNKIYEGNIHFTVVLPKTFVPDSPYFFFNIDIVVNDTLNNCVAARGQNNFMFPMCCSSQTFNQKKIYHLLVYKEISPNGYRRKNFGSIYVSFNDLESKKNGTVSFAVYHDVVE